MGDFNSERFSEPLTILQKSGLQILNYSYKISSIYTYIYKSKKMDLDYFIENDLLLNKCKTQKITTIHSKDIQEASDHFPMLLEIEINK